MKRVFIVDEHISSKQNGVGTFMQQFLNCMQGEGIELNFLSFNSDEKDFSIFTRDAINYYCFPYCARGAFLKNGDLFIPLLRLYVPDSRENVFFVSHSPCSEFLKAIRRMYPLSKIVFIIHDQGWTAPLLGDKQLLRKILSMKRLPKKNYPSYKFVRQYCLEERKMFKLSDVVVCLSHDTYKLLEEIYQVPVSKITLIPNGKDFSAVSSKGSKQLIRKELGLQADEIVLLYVGRTVKAKGIYVLLQAFEIVHRKYPQTHLVIAGEVFSLNDFAKMTPHSAVRITYIGLIPQESLNRWYKASDIGVLPSYTEQCSFAGIEMLGNGFLIVSTNGNGLREMFRDGENALIADIGNTEDENEFINNLAETLLKAIELPMEIKQSVCRKAQKDAVQRYSVEKMREGYQKILNKII